MINRLGKLAFRCAIASWSSLALLGSLRSQTQSVSPPPKQEIRVATNEVVVPVTVTDAHGEFVLNLSQKDFHVYDEGVEQNIDHWDLGGDSLAVALLIETSSHMEVLAPVVRGIGTIFTETVMALSGEASVITYDSTVDVRQPFTKDHDAIQRAIARVNFEAPEIRLYDAMDAAVESLKTQPATFRRVMLIIGESQDIASDAKLGLVLREAQLANISIYAVGLSSSGADLRFGSPEPLMLPGSRPATANPPGKNRIGRPFVDWMTPALWLVTRGTNEIKNHQLEVAAAATGGIHYRAFHDNTIRDALDQIGGELHAQYIVGYRIASKEAAGFHAITVKVSRPNVSTRVRPGYYIASPEN
jgi:VWFA-related protein